MFILIEIKIKFRDDDDNEKMWLRADCSGKMSIYGQHQQALLKHHTCHHCPFTFSYSVITESILAPVFGLHDSIPLLVLLRSMNKIYSCSCSYSFFPVQSYIPKFLAKYFVFQDPTCKFEKYV